MGCDEYIFEILNTQTIYLDAYTFSGKFLNEFGDFAQCNGLID
jgi:hypothetical protein